MFPVSAEFLTAIRSSHSFTTHASLWRQGWCLVNDFPVTGSFTVDGRNAPRRTAQLEIPARIANGDEIVDIRAMLGRAGVEIHLRHGLRLPIDRVEWVPLGHLRVEGVADSMIDDALLSVDAVSREADLIDDKFVIPKTVIGVSTATVIINLIKETIPTATVLSLVSTDLPLPETTFAEDRWGAISQLATSITASVYVTGDGQFVLADAPKVSAAPVPVWSFHPGVDGTLVEASTRRSRQGVVNCWVVRGESPGGDFLALQGVVRDDVVSSPTRWGDPLTGAYGKITGFRHFTNVTTVDQAHEIGRSLLAKSTGSAQTVDLTAVPNPALEPGDIVKVEPASGPAMIHVLDCFTLPLNTDGSWTAGTRELKEAVPDGN